MPERIRPSLSEKYILQIFLKKGLLSKANIKDLLAGKQAVQARLEKNGSGRPGAAQNPGGLSAPASTIDIVAAMEFKRLDDPARILDEEAIFQTLADEWGIPYKKIDPIKLNLNVVTTTIPRSFAMKHLVMPIEIENGCLTLATTNPFNVEVLDDIARVSNLKVRPVVSSKTDIVKLINEFFGFKHSISAAEDMFAAPIVDLGNLERYVQLKSTGELPSNDQHIVNAVNHLFIYAFDQRASDIHIEPKRDISLVRLRIDGVLHTVYKLPKKVHAAIVSRIKTMARLDTAEKRKPQDGRLKTAKGEVEAEIRISTLPVAFGEKIVMRVMDPEMLFQDLEGLGFGPDDLKRYYQIVKKPHGIALVVGPTGSGKSTTLYSTLRYLSTPEINVTSIEDPIEMVHEEFNQIAVQPAVNITFATILRTILRQDPDIIMVGEMRDLETAQSAVQAALTGHLVLSTLHTNDAPTAITRLLDLGVPAFLIRATLTGVIAQRLVRKICPHCKESFEMDCDKLALMGLNLKRAGTVRLYRGGGCVHCRGTGYRGRSAVFEVLPISDAMRQLTDETPDITDIRALARREGMLTMRENALKKLVDGVTTYEEVIRVTWEQQ